MDVGFEQRHAHLAKRFVDLRLGQAAVTAQAAEDAFEPIGKGLEHPADTTDGFRGASAQDWPVRGVRVRKNHPTRLYQQPHRVDKQRVMSPRSGVSIHAGAPHALELGLVRVRWFAVAFGVFQIWRLGTTPPYPPRGIIPLSYASIAVLAIGNVFISRAVRRAAHDTGVLRRIGFVAYGLDIAVVFTNIWLGSFDRNATGWNLAYILPLEGAIRYELRGVTAAIALFFGSELARELYRLSLFDEMQFEIAAVTFRVGIFALIGFVAGIMARNLHRQTVQAELQAEANARLVDRESQGRAEVQAVHDVVLAGLEGGTFANAMARIVDAIASSLGYETLAIRLVDDGPGHAVVRCVGSHGLPYDTGDLTIPMGRGVAGRVIASGRSEVVTDVRSDPDYIEWIPGIRSEMVVPIKDGDGPIGVLEVQSSVPERFCAEDLARLERFATQIGLVVSNAKLLELERATIERLRQLDTMKSDFVAVTSHELRTPLTSVQGFIKTLRRPDVSLSESEVQEFLAIVDRQTERLARLVEDLLLASRIEAGTIDLEFSTIDAGAALNDALEDLEKGRDRVQLAIEPEMAPVATDARRLGQIARNLIENAIKFSPDPTPVRVTMLSERSGSLLLEVTDDGPGISPDELPHIFDRFHQVGDALRRETRGLGLGLYIVRNLVDALNGSVEVRSVVGQGTTFTVRLPLVRQERMAEGA
jgi:signal transduction histidine kinase